MEQTLVDVLKWLFSRSDPMLAGCILVLGYWIWNTNVKIDKHMDSKNREPHAFCEFQGIEIEATAKRSEEAAAQLGAQMEKIRTENREDHQQIFNLLRGRE